MSASRKPHDRIDNAIAGRVRRLTNSSQFVTWLDEDRPKDGDLIVLNNSFVYRKPLIATPKKPRDFPTAAETLEVPSQLADRREQFLIDLSQLQEHAGVPPACEPRRRRQQVEDPCARRPLSQHERR